jgi:acyl-CoA synthetase
MSAPTAGFRNIVDPLAAERFRANGWWGDVTVSDHVRRHAGTQGAKVAYVTPDHSMTYRELDAAADRVAAALVTAGANPGDRAAILLPDGPTIHAVLVGAERAGVTAVGIGARAGDRELRHLLIKTGARLIVTFAEHRGAGQADAVAALRADGIAIEHHIVVPRFEAGSSTVHVDGIEVVATALSDADERARRIGPDDLFLINSTSGTTGLPKCVMHHQNRWMYFHRKAVENGALSPDDVFFGAVATPFGFGVWTSHVTPLVLGATVLTVERFDAAQALDLIERERVTVLCCVSTQFIMLLGEDSTADLSSLRVMFTGGEPVPYLRALDFEDRTGATVLQFYGSNETGLLSGTTLADDADHRLHTAGRIAAEMEVRLFDNGVDVTSIGRGQPGCRGPALSPGYLDDEAANAQLFTGDGWMLMADVCTVDDDGYMSVVGRTSDIIIRGGKNISAPQVESEVATHPAVAHVAAVAAPDPVFGERVAVYVQLRAGATSLELGDLSAHLIARGVSKEIFPEHLFVIDELPLSSGGKVAKGDLRDDVKRRVAG